MLWPEIFTYHQLWIRRSMIPKGEQEEASVFPVLLSEYPSQRIPFSDRQVTDSLWVNFSIST